MGSRERLENSEQKSTSPKDVIDYLDELFAYALSIGMNYEQYWLQNPYLFKTYQKAEEYRIISRNRELWLQGLYNHIALNVSLSNAFSKNSHAKYLEKPIPLTQKEQEEEEERKLKRFTNFMDSMVVSSQEKEVSKK